MHLLRSSESFLLPGASHSRKRCGHLISLTPLVVSDSSGMRATFQHGFHHTYCSSRKRSTGTQIQPKEIKRDSGWNQFCTHPLNNRLLYFVKNQPHWRDLHDQATRLDFVNWWSAQCILFYVSFHFLFSFPFLPQSCCLGTAHPNEAQHKSFNTDSFSKVVLLKH